MNIQTFSIVGRSADGTQLGVAVASKFLAVGAYVPAARAEVGAVATQAMGNMELRTRGLDMLADGVPVSELFEKFFADDPYKENRQAGVVDDNGQAATYTGSKCSPWAGGYAEESPDGSFAIQGNCLAGPEVIDAMVAAWRESGADTPLSRRLLHTLSVGQEAGGDPRGKQAAALLVVGKGQGYGGLSDVAVDLRSDDSPSPIGELQRMLDLHDLYFGKTPEAELLDWNNALTEEVGALLQKLGYASGDLMSDLERWMGIENYEERWHDNRLDPVVLAQLRLAAR
jgi:uncharacterized Ntn-hydrolase superfamily protein